MHEWETWLECWRRLHATATQHELVFLLTLDTPDTLPWFFASFQQLYPHGSASELVVHPTTFLREDGTYEHGIHVYREEGQKRFVSKEYTPFHILAEVRCRQFTVSKCTRTHTVDMCMRSMTFSKFPGIRVEWVLTEFIDYDTGHIVRTRAHVRIVPDPGTDPMPCIAWMCRTCLAVHAPDEFIDVLHQRRDMALVTIVPDMCRHTRT